MILYPPNIGINNIFIYMYIYIYIEKIIQWVHDNILIDAHYIQTKLILYVHRTDK